MFKCECGKEFINPQSFNGHKSHCKEHYLAKYGSLDKLNENALLANSQLEKNRVIASNNAQKAKSQKLAKWIAEKHTCEKCGKIMTEKFGSGRFCSRACANSRNHSEETKEKIRKAASKTSSYSKIVKSNAAEQYLKNPKYCACCGNIISFEFRKRKCCSDTCAKKLKDLGAKKGGLKAATVIVKRSKNEVYFCELCENHFKQVKHNLAMFNGWDADVIIEDIKYAILWNGPWHYRKITKKHSVEQVQNRDKIKCQEIERAGYKSYIIKDPGKYNKKFVEEQFNKFLTTINI